MSNGSELSREAVPIRLMRKRKARISPQGRAVWPAEGGAKARAESDMLTSPTGPGHRGGAPESRPSGGDLAPR